MVRGVGRGRADYNEWGEITYREALDITSSYRRIWPQSSYTGHDWDDVLGMYYAKARFYSAEDKRFVAVDPVKGQIIEPLSLVPYVYCVDNPLRWVDPMGLRLELRDDLGGFAPDVQALPQGTNFDPDPQPGPRKDIIEGNPIIKTEESAITDTVLGLDPDPQPGLRKDIITEEDPINKIEEPVVTDKVYKNVRDVIASKLRVTSPANASAPLIFPDYMEQIADKDGIFSFNPILHYHDNFEVGIEIKGIINGQGLDPVKNMRYGYSYMERAGCGLIAIYNALVLLDNPQNLADIVLWGEFYAAVLGGYFGSAPRAASGLLREMGYTVKSIPASQWLVFDVEAKKADVCLFTYWNDKGNWADGMHTVCTRYEINILNVYNPYSYYGYSITKESFAKWIVEDNLGPVAFLTVSKC